jgi:phage replication initiation protein
VSAKVDWCTATYHPETDRDVVVDAVSHLREVIGPIEAVSCPPTPRYERGFRLFLRLQETAIHVARIDTLGPKGRARFDVAGAGCSAIGEFDHTLDWLGRRPGVEITRCDLAVDCLNGEFTVDDAVAWFLDGEFRAEAAGRDPRHQLMGDWLAPVYGRTFEVGRSENGKMARCYEKGRQLGDPASEWNRFELELRNNDRELPLDVLTECDRYFAGAYRCFKRLVGVTGERIATQQKEAEIALARLSMHATASYGKLIQVLRLRMEASEVLDFLARPGIPGRLEKASLAEFMTADSPAAHLKEKQREDACHRP